MIATLQNHMITIRNLHCCLPTRKVNGEAKRVANGDHVTIWDLLNSSNLDCNNCHCKSTWSLDIMLYNCIAEQWNCLSLLPSLTTTLGFIYTTWSNIWLWKFKICYLKQYMITDIWLEKSVKTVEAKCCQNKHIPILLQMLLQFSIYGAWLLIPISTWGFRRMDAWNSFHSVGIYAYAEPYHHHLELWHENIRILQLNGFKILFNSIVSTDYAQRSFNQLLKCNYFWNEIQQLLHSI